MEKRNQKEHEYRKNWNEIWKTLSMMRGLIELKVQMTSPRGNLALWKVKDFEIITTVKSPKNFVLVLPDELVLLVKSGIHSENLEVEGFLRSGG